jgi:hypothetical protein
MQEHEPLFSGIIQCLPQFLMAIHNPEPAPGVRMQVWIDNGSFQWDGNEIARRQVEQPFCRFVRETTDQRFEAGLTDRTNRGDPFGGHPQRLEVRLLVTRKEGRVLRNLPDDCANLFPFDNLAIWAAPVCGCTSTFLLSAHLYAAW